MSQNLFINEIEWSYRQAALEKRLERKRQLAEARAAQMALEATPDKPETNNKTTKKVGKETLGWNL